VKSINAKLVTELIKSLDGKVLELYMHVIFECQLIYESVIYNACDELI
jgi:hypothetical protein